MPILAGFTGGLEHINAYRIIMPIFGIGGALIGLFSYTYTKERIIVAKDYTPKVRCSLRDRHAGSKTNISSLLHYRLADSAARGHRQRDHLVFLLRH